MSSKTLFPRRDERAADRPATCTRASLFPLALCLRVLMRTRGAPVTRVRTRSRVCTRGFYGDQVSRRFTCRVGPGSCAGVFHSVLWTVVVRAAADLHVCSTRVRKSQKARYTDRGIHGRRLTLTTRNRFTRHAHAKKRDVAPLISFGK